MFVPWCAVPATPNGIARPQNKSSVMGGVVEAGLDRFTLKSVAVCASVPQTTQEL